MAIQAASIFTAVTVVLPAKIPWRSRPILRTPSLIVRTPQSITAARRFISTPLGAAPPRKYVYPDPIPEFAAAETEKFKAELSNRLFKENETFSSRNELDAVVSVCAEVESYLTFLKKQSSTKDTASSSCTWPFVFLANSCAMNMEARGHY
ncbi:PREDICTED: uncharacterized protein LOC109166165 isoform X2 [Ipomoea nil]|uniref:uncharacterized protein LOC109166165 isoform X2 n=1 Tax=Ipomoea nil TaxID=35883 RepID=UPI000901026D|nr:PREDICTED: uncharacterized protein LOC109166165 isoform X2 [Ipomoea nil]